MSKLVDPDLRSKEDDATAENGPIGATAGVSAIVITYFTGPLLARCINSLKLQPEISEIIIVDNGNWTDAVKKAAAPDEPGPDVHILSGQGNIGFAAACNLGAKKARSPYLLFLNPDAILPQGGLAQLLEDGQDKNHPWMIGAKLMGPDGLEQMGSRRETLTPWRAFVEAAKLYKLAPKHPYFRRVNLHSDPCPKTVTPVPVTSGACFLIPHKDYMLIDGMDEHYFLHVEDIDFCLRFNKAGGIVYFDPHVEVIHFKGSSRASRIDIEFHKTKGMQRYFSQHFSNIYPPLFLPLVDGLLWLRFGAYASLKTIRQGVSLFGLRSKHGKQGASRARAIISKKSVRK